jgi:hypothetical protein
MAGPVGPTGATGATGATGPAGPNTLPPGVTNGSNAAAGQIGEYISSVMTSGITMSSGAWVTITSILLSPGDWDVWGQGNWGGTTGSLFANNISNSQPPTATNSDNISETSIQYPSATTAANCLGITPARFNITGSSQTIYLTGYYSGAAGCNCSGKLCARRVR